MQFWECNIMIGSDGHDSHDIDQIHPYATTLMALYLGDLCWDP
jgi:hypothetical protein